MRRPGRKRREISPSPALQRWVLSYADFVTLLMAFFVVMYALSSINEAKYRFFARSMNSAFSEKKDENKDPMAREPGSRQLIALSPQDPKGSGEGVDGTRYGGTSQNREEDAAAMQSALLEQQRLEAQIRFEQRQLDEAKTTLDEALAEFTLPGNSMIEIHRKDYAIELDVKSALLFPSGSHELTGSSHAMLDRIAEVLARLPNMIHVEGHTDNRPIASYLFPSNWELSSARAASVVHYLTTAGVPPEHMVAMGYGEYDPIASNLDDAGRYQNRRVVIKVMSGGFGKSGTPDTRR
ncbi:MAG: hypothetical protein RIQ52_1322 [Pseudomonadota bacterium]|jgi:chemotaxis protein MotB